MLKFSKSRTSNTPWNTKHEHHETICRVLNVRGNILCRKFHMCSVPVKLKLFNSYCSSLYTPHLWWNYKKMSVTKLQLKRNIGLSK